MKCLDYIMSMLTGQMNVSSSVVSADMGVLVISTSIRQSPVPVTFVAEHKVMTGYNEDE